MALTQGALIELVKQETQGFALRSLGELTTCRNEIGIPTVRTLLMNLTSIRFFMCFAGSTKAADLAALLSVLLERYEYGEITRGRAVLDAANRVFGRLSEISANLEHQSASESRLRARGRAPRTLDLEQELLRLMNLERVPDRSWALDVTSRSSYVDALRPLIAAAHDDGCCLTLTAFDLLQQGERLPELLPLLGNLAERGVLLRCGLLQTERSRRQAASASTIQSRVGFLIFRTELPWQPTGVFSRIPAMKVTALYDPHTGDGDGKEWSPSVPALTPALVGAALAGRAAEAERRSEEAGTALIPYEESVPTVVEKLKRGRPKRGERLRSPGTAERPRAERRTTIGFKLITIISTILILSLSGMILVASSFFRSDVTVRIEENTHTLALVSARAVEREFQSIISSTQLFLNMVSRFSDVPSASQMLQTAFFAQSAGIGYVGIPGVVSFFNDTLLDGRQLRPAYVQQVVAAESEALASAAAGVATVVNLSPKLRSPMIAIVLPYRSENALVPLVIVSALDSFVEAVQTTGITHTFVVNARGQLIMDADLTLLGGDIDYSTIPIVDSMLKSPIDNGQLQYADSRGVRYLGSFKRTGFAGVGVVVSAPASKAFEAVRDIQRRNLLLMGVVLALAILVVYYFSKTITRPVGRLVGAAQQIAVGKFLLELKPTTRDEIGLLTETFVEMGRGLHERERIKDAFGKFVSKNVAEQAMRDEIRLGGERRVASILFSDIRSFTAISEKLQPEEVVEFLNQYMTRMVECVNETGGVVDKFIGDAIMAVWGVPISRGNDAENAINGALMMRQSLQEFNRDRGSVARPIIRIGCGINSGPVIAGQIGSTERMEYTVIGDAVNLASRIEALNKPFGTDILISSDTLELVGEIFDVVPQLKIKVKGKTAPQQIYAVLGRLDDHHRPKTMRELQQLIGVDPASLKQHKGAGEEVKYEILDE